MRGVSRDAELSFAANQMVVHVMHSILQNL
jgi:hypothetical protein